MTPYQRDAFAAAERALAANPADDAARERMLDLFIAAGQPDTLPGLSLPLPEGYPPPRIGVITPYRRESAAVLARCAASVRAQTVPALHVAVADGEAHDALDSWGVLHVRLPVACNDTGDTPRKVAARAALDAGCIAIAYLDADNAWRPHHLESLLARHLQTGAPVVHGCRTFHEMNGALLPLLEAGDNVAHVDTNTLFLAEDAAPLAASWGSWPAPLSVIGDRVFWAMIVGRGLSTACTGALTAAYTADRTPYYRVLGRPPPPGVRGPVDFARMFAFYDHLDAHGRAGLDAALGIAVAPLVEARRRPASP